MILNKLEAASAPSTEIGLLSASTSCQKNNYAVGHGSVINKGVNEHTNKQDRTQ